MKLILLLFCFATLLSCNKDEVNENLTQSTTTTCNHSNTLFNQVYNLILNETNFEEDITMDNEVHAYTFEVQTNKTLCEIGYQSIQGYEANEYFIELYDNTINSVIVSFSSTFSSTETSYVSVTPVQLLVGHSYTIRRKIYFPLNPIGRVARNFTATNNLTYPIVNGDIKIIGALFYDSIYENSNMGSSYTNKIFPYINIVFQN